MWLCANNGLSGKNWESIDQFLVFVVPLSHTGRDCGRNKARTECGDWFFYFFLFNYLTSRSQLMGHGISNDDKKKDPKNLEGSEYQRKGNGKR